MTLGKLGVFMFRQSFAILVLLIAGAGCRAIPFHVIDARTAAPLQGITVERYVPCYTLMRMLMALPPNHVLAERLSTGADGRVRFARVGPEDTFIFRVGGEWAGSVSPRLEMSFMPDHAHQEDLKASEEGWEVRLKLVGRSQRNGRHPSTTSASMPTSRPVN